MLRIAPGFVEDVYRAALTHDEESETSTTIGGESRILGLRSTRRQDYRQAHHHLGELFPKFMEIAPVEATGAVIAAVEKKVSENASVPLNAITSEEIILGTESARFAEDVSHIWDEGYSNRYDIHLRMLDGFEEGLVRLGRSSRDVGLLDQVLSRIARDNRFAAIWRRLLAAGTREPGLGVRIWTLAASTPVLVAGDTVELVGRYLKHEFALLGVKEREQIERAILSIRESSPDDAEYYHRRRDRLLGCLPEGSVVTPDALSRLNDLASVGGPPPNTPLFKMGEVTSEEYTEDQWLADQGVALEAEPNRKLRERAAPVATNRLRKGDILAQDSVDSTLLTLRALRKELDDTTGADERVVESSWTHLTAACTALAGMEWLDDEPELAGFVRAVLLEASRSSYPCPSSDRNDHYETYGGLSPSPRWEAACGLLNLIRFPKLADADIVVAIRRLGEDTRTEIRAEVARRVGVLFRPARDSFWQILRRIEAAEASRRTVRYALNGVRPLVKDVPNELVDIAHTVFERFRSDSSAAEIRSECLGIVIDVGVLNGDPYRDELISSVLNNFTGFPDETVFLVQAAASNLTIGPVEPSDSGADRLRHTGIEILYRIAELVSRELQALEVLIKNTPRAKWVSEVPARIEAAQKIAHELGIRVYFASGSFDRAVGTLNSGRGELTEGVRRRFLNEVAPLLGRLVALGLPDVVHHALETLSGYVAIDPRVVFLAAVNGVRHGANGGYQYEPLAVSLVVDLLRRYLADYRTLFRDDEECRAGLIQVLNIFVRAGWPEVLELTYRLEEIFR
jgi:hypothetical protein